MSGYESPDIVAAKAIARERLIGLGWLAEDIRRDMAEQAARNKGWALGPINRCPDCGRFVPWDKPCWHCSRADDAA